MRVDAIAPSTSSSQAAAACHAYTVREHARWRRQRRLFVSSDCLLCPCPVSVGFQEEELRARRALAHFLLGMMQQTMLSVAGARPAVGSRRSSAVRCAAGPAGPPPEPTKLWDISAAKGKQKQATVAALPPPPPPPVAPAWQTPALAAAGVVAVGAGAKLLFGEKPYRAYTADSVGREYDAWTEEGILEYYWVRSAHLDRSCSLF